MNADFLRTVPFLSDLSDDDLTALDGCLEEISFPAATQIIEEGSPMTALYIVTSGVVHVRKQSDQSNLLLARIPTGGFFGEMNLFSEGAATAGIFSVDGVSVARVSNSVFREFMESHPDAGYKILAFFMRELAHRLKQTNDRLANNVFWSQS